MKIAAKLLIAVLMAAALATGTVQIATADCDPNDPPPEGCYYYPPLNLQAKLVVLSGGTSPSATVRLTWSYGIPANSPSAPDSIYLQRGVAPVKWLPWDKNGMSKNTTFQDVASLQQGTTALAYEVCSWYNSLGYIQNLCQPAGVKLPSPPPPSGGSARGGQPGGNASQPSCDRSSPFVFGPDRAELHSYDKAMGYVTHVTLGYSASGCQVNGLRVRRFTDNATDPDYDVSLDPASWTRDLGGIPDEHVGVFADPADARAIGDPNTPGLATHRTYRYETCARYTSSPASQACHAATAWIPLPPPDAPAHVTVCPTSGHEPCVSINVADGPNGTKRIWQTRPMPGVTLAPPSTGGPSGSSTTTSPGTTPRPQAPSNIRLGYQITWPRADNRTAKVDVQRYDPRAPDHWTVVATVEGRATSAAEFDPPASLAGYTYRVCLRGEAYYHGELLIGAPLTNLLAHACSPPATIGTSPAVRGPRFTPTRIP